MKKYFSFLLCATLLFNAPLSLAQSDLDSRIWEADQVIKEYMMMPESSIPDSLLKSAKAIAIFPATVKAGFVLAGQYGKGVVVYRNEATNKWSAPAFFKIAGGSIGFQIGGQASDSILVITTERGVRGLLANKFTLGADISVAAGPVGRDAEAKTDWKARSSIYSYSRSKGLFAGVSLDGMVINADRDANAAYYGSTVTTQDILLDGAVEPSKEGLTLIDTISQYTS